MLNDFISFPHRVSVTFALPSVDDLLLSREADGSIVEQFLPSLVGNRVPNDILSHGSRVEQTMLMIVIAR